MKHFVTALGVIAGLSTTAIAQVIDGTLDPMYGNPTVIQDTPTGFGDNNNPDPAIANGSELNALYFTINNGNLNLMLTGNLENNNNRIYIFFDSTPGGQNTLSGQTGITMGGVNGLQFDLGFDADYAIVANGDGGNTYVDYVNLQTMTTTFAGRSTPGSGNGMLSTGDPMGLSLALNNSNTAGVSDSSAAGAAFATTGLELQIPLSLIGSPTGEFRLMAFIGGSGDPVFVSNQVLGGVGGAGNLGAANTVNFANIAGDQFVAIPEPSTYALLMSSAVFGAWVMRRRRS